MTVPLLTYHYVSAVMVTTPVMLAQEIASLDLTVTPTTPLTTFARLGV